jgi:hypothetical protein
MCIINSQAGHGETVRPLLDAMASRGVTVFAAVRPLSREPAGREAQ